MNSGKHLIVVAGPTASGKTSMGIALAKYYNTDILSADSRQFYKELSVGTAKPDLEEQDGIRHHFIDSHSIQEEISVADYEHEALNVITNLLEKKDVVIMVGGSGQFIDAVCYGLNELPVNAAIKQQVIQEYEKGQLDELLQEIQQKDPIHYEKMDRQNPMRVIRAVEILRISNQSITRLQATNPEERPFNIHYFVLNWNRDVLYERINQRVDNMIENGLIDEVKALIPYKNLPALRTVGYQELFSYFEGKYSLPEAIEAIKQNSRRYAKRQLTWFRRHQNAHWVPCDSDSNAMQFIQNTLNQLIN